MAPLQEVVLWMIERIVDRGVLYQDDAAWRIRDEFGEHFVHLNDNGNLAISPRVLAEFRRETEGQVVWERGERCWRKRVDGDGPGRQQEG